MAPAPNGYSPYGYSGLRNHASSSAGWLGDPSALCVLPGFALGTFNKAETSRFAPGPATPAPGQFSPGPVRYSVVQSSFKKKGVSAWNKQGGFLFHIGMLPVGPLRAIKCYQGLLPPAA